MTLRTAPIALLAIAVLLLASGCDTLKKNVATSGPGRYKAEVAALAGEMQDQLSTAGVMNDQTRKKFDSLISRYENDPEVGKGNSMRNLKEAQKELDLMTSDAANSFRHKENVQYNITEALRALETEVRTDS